MDQRFLLSTRIRCGHRVSLRNRWECFFAIAVSLVAALHVSAADPPRPNVVLIMTDNHGAWTLGCYGNPDIRTPNIDRLAAEGTLFTRAFASNPVCSPTRATCLTGLVPSQHGVHSFLSGGGLQTGPEARCTLDRFTSLPEVLRDAGYACGLVGKWHLGGNLRPQEGLDDYWITMPHGGTSTFYNAPIIQDGEIRNEPTYLTDLWTQHAVKFIDQQATQDEPFFLFLAYNGPYSLGRLLLRDGQNRHAAYYADKEVASFPRIKPHPWQLNNLDFINNPTSIRRVATEVSGVDDGVGEVMGALKKHNLDENTVVVFVADQGWVGGHGGFFGMGDHTRPLTARDGMMRIPLIWRHPKRIAADVRSDQMIANYDLMPTLLGHLGMHDKMPASPQSPGSDFSVLLAGETTSDPNVGKDAVFYEFENLRCVRTTTHKYVHRHPNGPHELFDLVKDPDEFVNLADDPQQAKLRAELKSQLDGFYAKYSLPEYDMWNGGTSQVRIHDGIDEEVAQLASVEPPPWTDGFEPASLRVPDGFTVELAAGPPLVTHPTMACFDDSGRLYVCNNAGVNMSNDELEKNLPNSIRQLVDSDRDGQFDSWTVFADNMTFPMGGVWHDGSLYVASPPNIWRLTDTDDDGKADVREVIVNKFGYNGNAASIHGCFIGPEGRIYWTDGYHGHEFKDDEGKVTSKREGSYIFSCRPDGSDARIHCGGGMDNPVEVDFTESGDMLGTVNILYTRPRVDCLVHWLHGGAYPHRERVLSEIKVTGDLLGPAHRFGHVAVSGMTRYRSGVIDHRWRDDLFTTFFNSGKVVRLSLQSEGSTYGVTQHEFLASNSREFHPTDVLEDADGSLLVVDTGGWFYRGCPTSQFAKPELLGGIYRIRRAGMTPMVDPRGLRIDWPQQTPAELVTLLNDTRFAVRQRAIGECAKRGPEMVTRLASMVVRGDIRVRMNATWALAHLAQQDGVAPAATTALCSALEDPIAGVRQAACRGLAVSVADVPPMAVISLLQDDDPAVRREAATTLGMLGHSDAVAPLIDALDRVAIDRGEEHAIVFALIEIGDAAAMERAVIKNERARRSSWIALSQIDGGDLQFPQIAGGLDSQDPLTRRVAAGIAKDHPQWTSQIAELFRNWLGSSDDGQRLAMIETLLPAFLEQEEIAALAGGMLERNDAPQVRSMITRAIADSGSLQPHASWVEPLRRQLASEDDAVVAEAVSAVASLSGNHFRDPLTAIAWDDERAIAVRMNALSGIVRQSGSLDKELFTRLIGLYQRPGSPTASSRAAKILGAAKLSQQQLLQIAALLTRASPTDLRELLRGFQRQVDRDVADAFLKAIESADSLLSLADSEFSDVIKRFPPETLDRANRLLDQLREHQQQKRQRVERLRDQLAMGNAERGRQVFMSEKAKCSSCHRVGESGHRVGPDLTTIGANRTADDLLESIVFPSASIVRDYESYQLLTVDGRVMTGLVVSESMDTIEMQQPSGQKVLLEQTEIERFTPSAVSIMPAGLDEALSETQLLDVVTYLQSLK